MSKELSEDAILSGWQFACDWYSVEDIFQSLNRAVRDPLTGDKEQQVPNDVASREFAEWLTHQYRLAMNKGIEIGRRQSQVVSG